MNFVNYAWGSDDEESESEDWAAYKTKHNYKKTDKTGKANLKRQFFARNVDTDFEKTMLIPDEKELQAFNFYCGEYNALGEIGRLPRNADMVMVFT